MTTSLFSSRLTRTVTGLIGIAFAATACGSPVTSPDEEGHSTSTDVSTSDGSEHEPNDAPGVATDPDEAEPAVPVAVTIPDTPAGRQLTWLLDEMQPGSSGTASEAETRFASSFLEQVPPTEVVALVRQFGQQGPWVPVHVEGDDTQLHATITAAKSAPNLPDRLQVIMVVNPDEQIEGLRLLPAPDVDVHDLDDAATQLQALADDAGLFVAKVTDDATCTPVFEQHAQVPFAVGSAAKLYVLLAVSQAVENGTLTWDTEVALTDKDRSLPSGELQDEAAGTVLSVSELATAMIAISDNTATDHLITLVGRDAVEEAVVAAGHATPSLLTPFLRTREFFAIGWDEQRRADWRDVEGDAEAQRALVDQLPAGTGEVEVADVTDVVWVEGIDWFASLEDLCTAHASLDLGEQNVAEAVGTNPGIVLDPETWSHFAFKGGSAPGVFALSWSMDRADGGRWFVGMALNDREVIDEMTAIGVATAVVDLVEGLTP